MNKKEIELFLNPYAIHGGDYKIPREVLDDKLDEFLEENKQLKEKNKSLYGSINAIKKQNNNRYKAIKNYIKQIDKLKCKYLEAVDKCMQRDSKIQKAIEYIKKYKKEISINENILSEFDIMASPYYLIKLLESSSDNNE